MYKQTHRILHTQTHIIYILYSPSPLSFLIVILDSTVISEDRNRLVDFFFKFKIGLLVCIIKFCTSRRIFKYFKTRYSQNVINGLNNIH